MGQGSIGRYPSKKCAGLPPYRCSLSLSASSRHTRVPRPCPSRPAPCPPLLLHDPLLCLRVDGTWEPGRGWARPVRRTPGAPRTPSVGPWLAVSGPCPHDSLNIPLKQTLATWSKWNNLGIHLQHVCAAYATSGENTYNMKKLNIKLKHLKHFEHTLCNICVKHM
jgi:hypothetical protein